MSKRNLASSTLESTVQIGGDQDGIVHKKVKEQVVADSEDEELGKYCCQLGISKSNLLVRLREVPPTELRNGHIYELFIYIKKSGIRWKDIRNSLGKIYPELTDASVTTIRSSFEKVKKKRDKLRKNKDYIEDYFGQCYAPPKLKIGNTTSRTNLTSSNLKENVHLNTRSNELEKEILRLKTENERLLSEKNELREKLQTFHPHRTTQRVKRLKQSLCLWKNKYKSLLRDTNNMVTLRKKLQDTKVELSGLKCKYRLQAKRCKKLREQFQ